MLRANRPPAHEGTRVDNSQPNSSSQLNSNSPASGTTCTRISTCAIGFYKPGRSSQLLATIRKFRVSKLCLAEADGMSNPSKNEIITYPLMDPAALSLSKGTSSLWLATKNFGSTTASVPNHFYVYTQKPQAMHTIEDRIDCVIGSRYVSISALKRLPYFRHCNAILYSWYFENHSTMTVWSLHGAWCQQHRFLQCHTSEELSKIWKQRQ